MAMTSIFPVSWPMKNACEPNAMQRNRKLSSAFPAVAETRTPAVSDLFRRGVNTRASTVSEMENATTLATAIRSSPVQPARSPTPHEISPAA